MPRRPRQKSESGIYHIMLRGINQQAIFEDDEDYDKLLGTLKKYKAISKYKIYAYCVMSNHFHLLLKVENEDLEKIIKRIAGSYVYWYNLKYRRSGHLFQDRFKSEAVETDRYLLAVLRYIHQNPLKAGLCKNISEYKYSSYQDFMKNDSALIDINYVYSIIREEEFEKFNNERNNDVFLDYEEKRHVNDADALKIIENVSGCKNISEFQSLDKGQRDRCIAELKTNGLSIRQISRLTGVSFGIVRKL